MFGRSKKKTITVSTASPFYEYKVLGPVFGVGAHAQGIFSASDAQKAFDEVVAQLSDAAAELGADEVIGATFEYRDPYAGTTKGNDEIEIFGYGTAIKRGK